MNKTSVVVIAVFTAAVVGWLAIQKSDVPSHATPTGSAAVDAGAALDGEVQGELGLGGSLALPSLDGGIVEDDLDLQLDAGFEMPDGGELPELSDAPKSVQFGVVLVQFKGAQGAKDDARPYEEAKRLASELVVLARDDFAAAVKKGDPGSIEDAGKMYRNILEPAPEAVLFSLEKGQVSDPVDTPRGIWIVKRVK